MTAATTREEDKRCMGGPVRKDGATAFTHARLTFRLIFPMDLAPGMRRARAHPDPSRRSATPVSGLRGGGEGRQAVSTRFRPRFFAE